MNNWAHVDSSRPLLSDLRGIKFWTATTDFQATIPNHKAWAEAKNCVLLALLCIGQIGSNDVPFPDHH